MTSLSLWTGSLLLSARPIPSCGISLDGVEFGIAALDAWKVDSSRIAFDLFHQGPAKQFFAEPKRRGVGGTVKSPLDWMIVCCGGEIAGRRRR